MPRPTFWPFLPYPHLGATAGSIDAPSYVGSGPYAVSVAPIKFLRCTARALDYCFNRVSKWHLSVRIRATCPNTSNGEYQTLVVAADWNRLETFPDESYLHRQPQALTPVVNDPGRDFYILEGPDIFDMEI